MQGFLHLAAQGRGAKAEDQFFTAAPGPDWPWDRLRHAARSPRIARSACARQRHACPDDSGWSCSAALSRRGRTRAKR
eukprot:4879103-Pleurochrysis_carterae.AAC.1